MSKKIGNKLSKLMDSRGVTPAELSRRERVSAPYISQLRNDEKKFNPSLDVLMAFSRGLEMELPEFLMALDLLKKTDDYGKIKYDVTDLAPEYQLQIKRQIEYYRGQTQQTFTAGSKPGKGYYKCKNDNKVIYLESNQDKLPECPECQNNLFSRESHG